MNRLPAEFQQQLEQRFTAEKHVLLATLRSDGSPRISGTEVRMFNNTWWMGSMPDSRKAADMRRDPRIALHSAPEPSADELRLGDAKVSGRSIDVTGTTAQDEFVAHMEATGTPHPPGPFDLFQVDILAASIVRVKGNLLEITSWSVDGGLRVIERT